MGNLLSSLDTMKFYGKCIKCGSTVERDNPQNINVATCFECKTKRQREGSRKRHEKNRSKYKRNKLVDKLTLLRRRTTISEKERKWRINEILRQLE